MPCAAGRPVRLDRQQRADALRTPTNAKLVRLLDRVHRVGGRVGEGEFVVAGALPGGVYASLHAGLHWQKAAIAILLDLEFDETAS